MSVSNISGKQGSGSSFGFLRLIDLLVGEGDEGAPYFASMSLDFEEMLLCCSIPQRHDTSYHIIAMTILLLCDITTILQRSAHSAESFFGGRKDSRIKKIDKNASTMGDDVKLLLTVSGGLEDLADDQIQYLFKDALLNRKWHRRTSGSQLYLDLRRTDLDGTDNVANIIADAINKLDYVEYTYVLADSFDVPKIENEDVKYVLDLISESAAIISDTSIDFCMNLCNLVSQQHECNIDVGLSDLPGVLLQSPEINIPGGEPIASANAKCISFAVNTIYTRKDVAKAVVDKIIEFTQQYAGGSAFENDLWIDAGSGDGSLLENLPPQRSIGVDTNPTSSKVRRMDYLKITTQWLNKNFTYKELCVITNPPFSVSSRGDYTPIISFINHSIDALEAKFVAVICPSKFARERIWKSLGLSGKAHLWARFLLPQDSFYDPATGKSIHIHSFCLIFGRQPKHEAEPKPYKSGCHITAKRDKGSYPNISTAELKASLVSGLSKTALELVPERHAKYILNAKLLESSFELWWQLDPMQPCSLLNSNCAKIPNHSLGWMSLSVRPAVSLAMSSLAVKQNNTITNGCIMVNLMSGEGTIELEASRAVESPVFVISGDIRYDCIFKASQRIDALKQNSTPQPLVDLIVWDAQNLPLRDGFADAALGDLPIQGTTKKVHQQPVISQDGKTRGDSSVSLKYSSVLGESSRILRPEGRAAFLSVDHRSLEGAWR